MPFQPIQPVRPRRPQVGSVGKATAVTPVSQLPRAPIMARGILRVAVGVAILLPIPKRAVVAVTRPPRPVLVARQAPAPAATRQPVVLRAPKPQFVVITKRPRPVLSARQTTAAPVLRQPVLIKLPKRARRALRLMPVAAPTLTPRRGTASVLRLPPKAIPVVITKLLFRPLVARVSPPLLRGSAKVLPTPPPRAPFTISYVDTPPLLGHVYLYRWRSSNGYTYSSYGPVVQAAANHIPVQVQNLTAIPAAGQIVLTANPIAYALTYTIYWSMTPADPQPAVLVSGLTSPLFVVSVPDRLTRYFTMTASNYCGEGPKSAEISSAALAPVTGGGAGCSGGYTGGANCSGTTWTGNS